MFAFHFKLLLLLLSSSSSVVSASVFEVMLNCLPRFRTKQVYQAGDCLDCGWNAALFSESNWNGSTEYLITDARRDKKSKEYQVCWRMFYMISLDCCFMLIKSYVGDYKTVCLTCSSNASHLACRLFTRTFAILRTGWRMPIQLDTWDMLYESCWSSWVYTNLFVSLHSLHIVVLICILSVLKAPSPAPQRSGGSSTFVRWSEVHLLQSLKHEKYIL